MRETLLLMCYISILMLVLGKEKNVYGQVFGTTSSKKTLTVADCEKCIILTESVDPEVDIVDVVRGGELMWSWNTYQSNLPLSGIHLFSTGISDAKPVYDLKYIILTAGGGGKKGSGVAIIRISDKKIMFYAHVGGNTHSVELLPDGNIVTASSKGNYLTVLHVDTLHFPKDVYKKKIYIPDGHNVVWDKKRKVLWSAGKDHLYQFQYNFDCKKPNLTLKDSIRLPGNDAHDLFPVYGKDSLWFTSHPDGVYIIDMHTKKVSLVQTKFQENIKSVSSGPDNWPIIIMKPRVKWWSDKVIDLEGNVIFEKQGIKIYKARWFLSNHFSYYKHSQFEVCE